MGKILVEMNASGDMMTSRAEVAEAITFMHRLSQGFTAILPASEESKDFFNNVLEENFRHI